MLEELAKANPFLFGMGTIRQNAGPRRHRSSEISCTIPLKRTWSRLWPESLSQSLGLLLAGAWKGSKELGYPKSLRLTGS